MPDIDLRNLSKGQAEEVSLGIKEGLTKEQVSLYARADFDKKQMRQIRLGFEAGLSMEKRFFTQVRSSMHGRCCR